jgi:ABC-type lipoprotein release transport system permease subunit
LVTAKGDEDQMFLLNGFNAENTKMHHFTWYGNQNSIPQGESDIVISHQHAVRLNKGIGDNLTILTSTNLNFTMKIVGIHNEMISSGYVALNGGRIVLHNSAEMVDGIYIILDIEADKETLKNEIYELDNIEIILD